MPKALCSLVVAIGSFTTFYGAIVSAASEFAGVRLPVGAPDVSIGFLAAMAGGLLASVGNGTAEDGFITGSLYGWLGFAVGGAVAALAGVVAYPTADLAAAASGFGLLTLAGSFLGVPFGLAAGVVAAIAAPVRDSILRWRRKAHKPPEPSSDRDDAQDPFGWNRFRER